MLLLIFWGLVLSTVCYAALAAWRLSIAREHVGALYLGVAFAGTASWSGAILFGSSPLVAAAEAVRDSGWLLYLYSVTAAADQQDALQRKTRQFLIVLGGLILLRLVFSLVLMGQLFDQQVASTIFLAMIGLRWVFALLGILLAHYLFRSTASGTGSGFRLIVVALGLLWAYDLNLFTLLLLGYAQTAVISELRGLVALAFFPAFALAARRKQRWKITLSRQATTQSLLFVALGSYFVAISSATRALNWAGDYAADLTKIVIASLLSLVILSFALVPRLRARAKSILIQNLFEHRYDYRTEWLRFSSTIGEEAGSGRSSEERMIRSVVDITESVGGALLVVERGEQLRLAGIWAWPTPGAFTQMLTVDRLWLKRLAERDSILTLDEMRKSGHDAERDGIFPEWLLAESHAWAGVPLVKSGQLIGLILLGRPKLDRELDWEDSDLLHVIGQQVAVHLSDAYSQQALEEARRYEEFNRRFAFIIHDLKNIVSQLSLVSANATEHIANPKFQAAMALTLENATGKMTTLLARLSADRVHAGPQLTDVAVADLLQKLAQERRPAGSVRVSIEQECVIRADEEMLGEALGHLLTNAIEASPTGSQVFVSLTLWEQMAVIAVEDHGAGMSAEFIHKELFKPFSSTKAHGFGIGAAEARDLIQTMGGELDVVSVEGEGSRFLARFPLSSQTDIGRI